MDTPHESQQVCFHGYRLDTVSRVLHAPDGTATPLTGRAFDVLAYLIDQRPRVVDKDELFAAVWPGRVVEENNLTQAVSAVRRALGTGAGDHRFILTVPGRGYGFIAHVESGQPAAGQMPMTATPAVTRARPTWRSWARSRRGPWLIATLAVLLVLGAIATRGLRRAQAPPHAATLAVLPFHVLGSDRDDAMLELGMAETLIARLSHATRLRVLSLGSTQSMVDGNIDPAKAGAALGADFVVYGHIQYLGGTLRITTRLLALPSGRTLWADTVDPSAAHVFAAQDHIAREVASALSQRYRALGYSSPCDGADPDAYRAYLRGRFLLNRPDPRTVDASLAAFQEALRIDPACARAWAGIAAVRRMSVMVADHDPGVEVPLSDAAIKRALSIDPDSAQAYAALGFNQFWFHWDWQAAEIALRHAAALDPNLVDAHFALAMLYFNLQRHGEALREMRRAVRLDPLSPLVNALALHFPGMVTGDADSLARLDKVLELEPDFWITLNERFALRAGMGDIEGARKDLARALKASNRNGRTLLSLAALDTYTGHPDMTRKVLAELEERARVAYVLPSTLASVHMMLGEKKQAVQLLREGLRKQDLGLAFLTVWYKPLADQPGYQDLVARMKLPAPSAGMPPNAAN